MKNIPRELAANIDTNVEALRKEADEIGMLWEKATEAIEIAMSAIADLNEAVGRYNDVVTEANNNLESIADELNSYIDDRSDSWRDSDRGQAFAEWASDWEGSSVEEMEPFELAEELPEPDLSAIDNLESLPSTTFDY